MWLSLPTRLNMRTLSAKKYLVRGHAAASLGLPADGVDIWRGEGNAIISGAD